MRKILIIFILLVMTTISSNVYAIWSQLGNVTSAFSHKGTYIINTTITDNPCTTAGKFWWPTQDPNDATYADDAKAMFAIVLSVPGIREKHSSHL